MAKIILCAKKIRSKGGKARAKKIQERMTTEIADCIMKELDAKGVIAEFLSLIKC